MNQYGHLAQKHWTQFAPIRVAALPDPTLFFTNLGMEVEAQITTLAERLAKQEQTQENYLLQVGHFQTAHRIAEEIVLNQLVWVSDPALPLSDARDEWDQTRPMDSSLARWAEKMQDYPDQIPGTEELEEFAQTWALTVPFLRELINSEFPESFLVDHAGTLAEAANVRFMREVH